MNILVIGSGGREHAICYSFARSARVNRIFCAPGNAGIEQVAECVPIDVEDAEALVGFAEVHAVDLTFVGGESSLAAGVVDVFEARGMKIIGPTTAAARLESSKAFAKDFMKRHGVPTAEYAKCSTRAEAVAVLNSGLFGGPDQGVVVKADGLAAGKGVIVANDRAAGIEAIESLGSVAGAAADTIVLEELLVGREVSVLMFADGSDFVLMPPARDHKRIGDGDTGPNTGGMGTVTFDRLLTPAQLEMVKDEIIRPTLHGCIDEGFAFRGVLFLGIMLTDDGPKLLEYNVRFGDPEAQSILVRLETDLVEICEAIVSGRLAELDVEWRPGASATIVLASAGYPGSPKKGDPINGLRDAAMVPGVTIFHAGTRLESRGIAAATGYSEQPSPAAFVTAGGRVLGVTAVGDDIGDALRTAYTAVSKIDWPGIQFRRDIGK
ncbi:MAG: phosphoribosylamine--glycine ligase [Pyrinomonadaceae bacterium]